MADKNFEITYTTSSQNIILKFDNNSRFNGPFKITMAKSSVFLCGDKLFSVGIQRIQCECLTPNCIYHSDIVTVVMANSLFNIAYYTTYIIVHVLPITVNPRILTDFTKYIFSSAV